MEKNSGAAPAPTGCYKCGRPGHWSRDCPFPATDSSLNSSNPNPNFPRPSFKPSGAGPSKPYTAEKPAEKPKKQPKTRPKLTPELLLSDDGLGYVLRHFPKAFKYRGRGHEVSDLGNLIGLYSQWHSHLLPYYSFEQFIQKVEQVGATKRVRTCIRELRERVENGGDPSKLHEPPVDHNDPSCEPAVHEANNLENPSSDKGDPPLESQDVDDMLEEDPPLESHVADDMQEEMLSEIYNKATEEHQSSQVTASEVLPAHSSVDGPSKEVPANEASNLSEIQISEEQKARMEASRLKALEKAAARARSSQAV